MKSIDCRDFWQSMLTLSFFRVEVGDFIFGQICDILDQGNFAYVKWDLNRR